MRALVWKARFLLAAGALGLAATITVARLEPPAPPQVTIVVTDRPVLAGAPLTTEDVRIVHVPPQAAPADAIRDPAAAVGRVLALPVSEGTVISEPLLVTPGGGPRGPDGTVVAAVRLGDPALAQILEPGMHVDLLAPASTGDLAAGAAAAAYHLARRALILPVPSVPAPQSGGFGMSPTEDETTDLILVAVTPEEASLLANAAGWSAVTAVVVQ